MEKPSFVSGYSGGKLEDLQQLWSAKSVTVAQSALATSSILTKEDGYVQHRQESRVRVCDPEKEPQCSCGWQSVVCSSLGGIFYFLQSVSLRLKSENHYG